MASFLEFLKPPHFDDEETDRIAGILNVILLAIIVLVSIQSAISIYQAGVISSDYMIILGMITFVIGLRLLLQRGYVRATSLALVTMLWGFLAFFAWRSGGVYGNAYVGNIVVILIASLLLGWRAGVFFTGLTVVAGWVLAYYSEVGVIVFEVGEASNQAIYYTILLSLIAVLVYLLVNNLTQALAAARRSNRELSILRDELEQRVQDRTSDLKLAAEVGQVASRIRDLDELLTEAVDMIRDRFDLYYTQIYLTDETQKHLALKAGTGSVGEKLVARGHRLAIGSGSINGVAALNKRTVIVEDTATSPIFRPNPLLPETRSEASVPLIAGETVVGVLNLQSSQAHTFTDANLPAFEGLAGQLAIAIENAHLFADVVQAREEVEKQVRRMTSRSWDEFLDGIHRQETLGYVYENGNLLPVEAKPTSISGENQPLQTTISVTGEPVGQILLEADEEGTLHAEDRELIEMVARRVGQQIENMRLLTQAEQYRQEAEEASRRLIHEGWDRYQTHTHLNGFVYDLNEVKGIGDGHQRHDEAAKNRLQEPLQIQGATIGQLSLAAAEEAEAAKDIVTAVARRLSAHIENLRLSEQTELALAETKQRGEELAVINEISRIAASKLETKALMETVKSQLQRVLPIDSFTVALFDQLTNSLRFLYVYDRVNGVQYDSPPTIVEPHHISHRIIQTKEPEMVLFTAQEVEEYQNNQPPNLISDTASITASLLFAPMMRGEEIMGLISVQSYQIDAYTDSDLNLITGIASYVATALQNAQLFEEIRQQGEKERIINQVTEKIQRTLTMEDALQTAVAELGQALKVSHAQVEIMPAAPQLSGEMAVSAGNGNRQTEHEQAV